MLKCFSHFFACLLFVLIPLQGIAAANMSICNSVMQSNAQHATQDVTKPSIPCHDDMSSYAQHDENKTCKTSCATLCASLSGMTVLPTTAPAKSFLVSMQAINFLQQAYVSITTPSLQRPPIFLA